jgi:hypothetical protein
MAGRPLTYESPDERPVSVSLRLPRALYDQLQQRVSQRRLTMTEALLQGAQLWLDTPPDPREARLSDGGNTVMQEWKERFAALATSMQTQVETALLAALNAGGHQPSAAILSDNSNTVLQEGTPALKQCKKGHTPYPQAQDECPECARERKRAYRQRQADKRLGEIPA